MQHDQEGKLETITETLVYFCGRLHQHSPAKVQRKERCTDNTRASMLIPGFMSRYLISWRPLLPWGSLGTDSPFAKRVNTVYEKMKTVRVLHETQTTGRNCPQRTTTIGKQLSWQPCDILCALLLRLWILCPRSSPSRVGRPILNDSELSTKVQLGQNVNVSIQPALFSIMCVPSCIIWNT